MEMDKVVRQTTYCLFNLKQFLFVFFLKNYDDLTGIFWDVRTTFLKKFFRIPPIFAHE